MILRLIFWLKKSTIWRIFLPHKLQPSLFGKVKTFQNQMRFQIFRSHSSKFRRHSSEPPKSFSRNFFARSNHDFGIFNDLTEFWIVFTYLSNFFCKLSHDFGNVDGTQCGNYGNLLSLFFGKNFVKVTFLLKKSLNSWFDEIFFRWE